MTLSRLIEKCGCGTTPGVVKLAPGVFRFVASDATIDCEGDSISPDGWQLLRYRANPVVLLGHNQDQPVARARKVWVAAGKLLAEVAFPKAGESELSDQVRGRVEAGLITAMSVGARYLDWTSRDDGGRDVRSAELYELSLVAVPCNAGALRVASAIPREKARVMVSAADVIAAFRRPARQLVSKEQAVDLVRRSARETFHARAVETLCEESGALDESGLRVKMSQSPQLAHAVRSVLSRLDATADAIASAVGERLA